MKLIHKADIHLTTPREAIAGDLSDWGGRADYLRLCERLARFPIRTRIRTGNHGDRSTLLGVFPELADAQGFVLGVHDGSAGRCLFLDTGGAETHA